VMSRIKKVVGLLELQLQLAVKQVQNILVNKVNNFTSIEQATLSSYIRCSKLQTLIVNDVVSMPKKLVC